MLNKVFVSHLVAGLVPQCGGSFPVDVHCVMDLALLESALNCSLFNETQRFIKQLDFWIYNLCHFFQLSHGGPN